MPNTIIPKAMQSIATTLPNPPYPNNN